MTEYNNAQLDEYGIKYSVTPTTNTSVGIVSETNANDLNQQILEQVESKRYIEKEIERSKRFVPNIDFRKPENFVKYGSAEKYYSDSIQRILMRYPYDGSRAEALEWQNESSYLDLYMFENLYPKNIGYLSLNSWMSPTAYVTPDLFQSVNFDGYPNADDTYVNPYHVIEADDSQANIIDDLRGANVKYSSEKGLSVEYWAKLDSKETLETMVGNGAEGISIDVPLQMVNLFTTGQSENILFSSGMNYRVDNTGTQTSKKWYLYFDIQRFTAPASPETFYVPESYFASDQPTRAIIELTNPDQWAHIAVSVDKDLTRVYLNGTLVGGLLYENNTPPPNLDVLNGNIGSTIAPRATDDINPGEMYIVGPVGFSIDEFRLWNSTRKESQIKRYFWDHVGGGTNTDDANVDLGIYYKFNEGIYGNNVYDENVLDYSGRQTDSTILNYSASEVRHTSSSPLPNEQGDPVIYPDHPDVISLMQEYETIGKYYDQKNNSKMYNMIPGWITDEDQEQDSEVLKNMIQIMSSYLDTLYLQIEKLPEIVGAKQEYLYDTEKPEISTKKLLANKGFIVPELFVDSSLLEKFQHRTETEKLEKELSVVKNLIYRNVYNNSNNILKSKGTEKSLRNIFRCFGVDEELLKIRVYPVNQDIELDKPRAYAATTKKRYADFSSTSENQAATVFSYATESDTWGVITGSDSVNNMDMTSTTFECEVYFPKKRSFDGKLLSLASVNTASIAGVSSIHGGTENPNYGETNDTTQDGNQTGNYKIRFIKDSPESSSGHFSLLFPSGTMGEITSSTFEVYDNQRWNLSVRIGEKSQYSDFLGGSTQDYKVSFSGYNYDSTEQFNSFEEVRDFTDPAEAVQALTVSKRVFAGADVVNHASNVAFTRSDAMISSVRYWIDWLPDETLKNHALYPSSVGTDAVDNAYYYDSGIMGATTAGKQVNKMDLLVLNWDFSKIDFDALGGYYYSHDRSLSSSTGINFIDEKTNKKYSARFHFSEGGDTSVKKIAKVKQVLGARESEVDYIRDSHLITIKEGDYDPFVVNPDPVYNKVTIEKSYSAVINDEIVKYLASMSYFSNLVGRPVNKYRINYKELDFFKRKIFSLFNPENDPEKEPDIEKFIEYYKWIDESVNAFIKQIMPASSIDNRNALNVIESHLLERSKYHHKYSKVMNIQDRRTENIQATAITTPPRLSINNPQSSAQPAAEYAVLIANDGSEIIFITTDTVSYERETYPDSGIFTSETTTVQQLIDFRNAGLKIQIDFDIN